MILEHDHQSEYLKQWMVQKLKPICDADHEVLSEYIMALLRHDQPEKELNFLCLKQLEDFLQNDTKSFVTDLFDHLRAFGAFSGSYRPPDIDLTARTTLRKRSLTADDSYLLTSPTSLNPLDTHFSPPPSSAPIPQYTPTQSHPSFLHFPDAPTNPSNSSTNLTTSHIEPYVPTLNNPQRNPKRPRRSGFCRDYHFRGYCARGNNCQFSHDEKDSNGSSNSSFPNDHYSKNQSNEPVTTPLAVSCLPLAFTSSLAQQIPGLGGPLPVACPLPTPGYPAISPESHIDRSPYRSSRNYDRSSRLEGSLPGLQRSNVTLVVDNIPQSFLSDRAVREYFSTFGTLASVSVNVYSAQALVTFHSPEDAKRAYSSPQAVFNNRFVRIHFKRLGPLPPRRSYPLARTGMEVDAFGSNGSTSHMNSNGCLNKPSFESPVITQTATIPEANTSPHQLPSDPRVLSQREQELRLKIDAQKRILEQLNQKKAQKQNGTTQAIRDIETNSSQNEANNDASDKSKNNADSIDGVQPAASNTNSSLEPPATETSTFIRSSSNSMFISRGGRKMTIIPRSSRTSWTPSSASTKSFKLDNRSCTLAIKEIPTLAARETVKSYLEQFGTIVSATPLSEDESVPDLRVKFATRAAAEKALLNGTEVPQVGKLAMSWVAATPSATATSHSSNQLNSFIPGLKTSSHLTSFSINNMGQNGHTKTDSIPSNLMNLTVTNDDPKLAKKNQANGMTTSHDYKTHDHRENDDDLIDDFYVDDEIDGCWKR